MYGSKGAVQMTSVLFSTDIQGWQNSRDYEQYGWPSAKAENRWDGRAAQVAAVLAPVSLMATGPPHLESGSVGVVAGVSSAMPSMSRVALVGCRVAVRP